MIQLIFNKLSAKREWGSSLEFGETRNVILPCHILLVLTWCKALFATRLGEKNRNTKGNKNGCWWQRKISRVALGNMYSNWIRVRLNGWGYRAVEVRQAIRNGFKIYHLIHVMMALEE